MTAYSAARVRETIDLGHRIRAERRRLGWSQEELARRSGLSRPVIVDSELANRRVTALELLDLARALSTSMEALLGVAEPPAGGPAWLCRLSPGEVEFVERVAEFLVWQRDKARPAMRDTTG